MHRALGGLALVLLAIGLWLALGVAPPDAVQGNVQRIMYVHVPAILTAYVAIGLVLVASVAYLWTRRAAWDRVAAASGELAVCFVGLTLATGSIWGKPTWGTWWTWDARLTSSAILFVIYLGYLLLRSVVDDPERAATYAAVLGIVGALDNNNPENASENTVDLGDAPDLFATTDSKPSWRRRGSSMQ